jgi:hypothetical protein
VIDKHNIICNLLGFIKLGKEKREEVLFKNEGSVPAKIELKAQD